MTARETAPAAWRLPADAAALVAVSLWASAFVGVRSAGRELPPGALALGRLLVGSAVLGLVVLARREPLPPRRRVTGIALCGPLWFGAYSVLLNDAERRVDAGTAAMLVNLGPILIALLAGVVLREGFPRRLLVGCAVGFGGAALIGVATSAHGTSAGWGAGLRVAAAFAYAAGLVAEKPQLAYASPLQVGRLARMHGRCDRMPAVRAPARPVRRTRLVGARLDGVPRRRAHRRRLPRVGVRTGANVRRPPRLDDVSRAAPRTRALQARARGVATRARAARRCRLRWRRRRRAPLT
jgi:hypothetical protein